MFIFIKFSDADYNSVGETNEEKGKRNSQREGKEEHDDLNTKATFWYGEPIWSSFLNVIDTANQKKDRREKIQKACNEREEIKLDINLSENLNERRKIDGTVLCERWNFGFLLIMQNAAIFVFLLVRKCYGNKAM